MNPKLINGGNIMKKVILCSIIILSLIGLAGCSNKEIKLDAGEIKVNTMLVKSNGQLQVAFVEEFNKPSYNLEDLETYVTSQINSYNKKNGNELIQLMELDTKDGRAVILMSFAGMEQYSTFHDFYGAYFTVNAINDNITLPDNFVNYKDGKLVSKDIILKNGNDKVVVVDQAMDIVIEGDIKYYSENAVLEDKNEIKSAAEGLTFIVFGSK